MSFVKLLISEKCSEKPIGAFRSKQSQKLYHIALAYRVNNADLESFNPEIMDEDVKGSLWINWHELRKESCSPSPKKGVREL